MRKGFSRQIQADRKPLPTCGRRPKPENASPKVRSENPRRQVKTAMVDELQTEGAPLPMPLTLHPDRVSRKALAAGFARENTASLHRRLAPCRSK